MAEYVPGSVNTLAACSVCRAVFYDGKDAIVRANDHEASCSEAGRKECGACPLARERGMTVCYRCGASLSEAEPERGR